MGEGGSYLWTPVKTNLCGKLRNNPLLLTEHAANGLVEAPLK